ncbi:HNH endonuclease [Aquirufa sp.]|jgi:5-methylcytosine-specific restriction protein A|uniref:HNH endonuclease n=1 Tax=Aquirufa sp. TaxID=2676249 RepID=UPI0037851781
MRNPKWERDEVILALNLYFDENRGTIESNNPKIIELSELLNMLPIHSNRPDEEKFRNPNGVTLKLGNFLALDPNYSGKGMESYSKLDEAVFNEYFENLIELRGVADGIKKVTLSLDYSTNVSSIESDDIEENVREGKVLYKMHKVRERDRKIIAKKKAKVFSEKGKLECECCGFDFEKTYGELGKGFIECHHIIPLNKFSDSKETKLEDLALVCSNCHRMLHNRISEVSVSDLRQLLLK